MGFYDGAWGYGGVCSYYQLTVEDGHKNVIARSAGDLRSAPAPKGATEFVDVDREAFRLAVADRLPEKFKDEWAPGFFERIVGTK